MFQEEIEEVTVLVLLGPSLRHCAGYQPYHVSR